MARNRNKPCPCGTGKKFKHCCGSKAAGPRVRTASAIVMPDGTEVPLPNALTLATQLHQAGRFRQAGTIYRQLLDIQPRNVDALHLLGVVEYQLANYTRAVDLIGKAIDISPNMGIFHNNLGKALFALGKLNDAVEQYRKALLLEPNLSEGIFNLGQALCALNNYDEAASIIEHLLGHDPAFFAAYPVLNEILSSKGETEKALDLCEKALAEHPRNETLICCVGTALSRLGRIDACIAHYQKILKCKPGFADAHHNLGNALITQGNIEMAIAHYEQALALDPSSADTNGAIGNAFIAQGKIEMAIAHYERALELDPSSADANSAILMSLNYLPGKDAATIFDAHLRFSKRHEAQLSESVKPHPNNRSAARRLRVGYVSCDFRQHAVAHFIAPVLENHDRNQIQVFCYSSHNVEDNITRRMQTYTECWRKIFGLSDQQAAQQIRGDQIDILVDLGGHTIGSRPLLFARKPAPLQVTWLGYPNTTGLSAMDYRFTDAYADPIGLTDALHTERLIRLPDTFSCFEPPANCPGVAELPARKNGYITFGSFNNFLKLNPQVIALWAKILGSVPNARLMLKNKILDGAEARRSTLELFAYHGIHDTQLELVGHSQSQFDHLNWYNQMDIGLDAFPYTGTTTTCDMLWMGVPVVTLAGNTHVSRVGVSLMTNLGLPELIANSLEEYHAVAVGLANDFDALTRMREGLRARMGASPLTNASLFTRNVEKAYREIWEKWCSGAP